MKNKYQFLVKYLPYFKELIDKEPTISLERVILETTFEDFLADFELVEVWISPRYKPSMDIESLNSEELILSLAFYLKNITNINTYFHCVQKGLIYHILKRLSKIKTVDSIIVNKKKMVGEARYLRLKTGSVLFRKFDKYYLDFDHKSIELEIDNKLTLIKLKDDEIKNILVFFNKSKFEYWKNNYANILMKDGHQWHLEIGYKNDDSLIINGDNQYPYFYRYLREMIDYIKSLI